MKVRLACDSLLTCSGCEISLLSLGADLLEMLEGLELVHFPLLMDRDRCWEREEFQADIGLVSGGCGLSHDRDALVRMRENCTLLVALGTCATHGGIPALRNLWSPAQTLDTVYGDDPPDTDLALPSLLPRVTALDEEVKVDLLLPGCPPRPESIANALQLLMKGEKPVRPAKSVCDTCPTRRGGTRAAAIERCPAPPTWPPDQSAAGQSCLLEQGTLCLGPVTAAGCAVDGEPPCLRARVPCRGCFGPVHHRDNQMLGMMNSLVSQGIALDSLADRKGMLRFSGAHGLLRPIGRKR